MLKAHQGAFGDNREDAGGADDKRTETLPLFHPPRHGQELQNRRTRNITRHVPSGCQLIALISIREGHKVKKVLLQQGVKWDSKEVTSLVDNLLADRDKNDDGFIDYYEFRSMITT